MVPDTVKQTAFIVVAGVGLIYLYSNLMPTGFPSWMKVAPPAPPKAQKTGYPESDDVPTYQPSVETNEGETPISSQQSNFGK
jgi:hypothetical protein